MSYFNYVYFGSLCHWKMQHSSISNDCTKKNKLASKIFQCLTPFMFSSIMGSFHVPFTEKHTPNHNTLISVIDCGDEAFFSIIDNSIFSPNICLTKISIFILSDHRTFFQNLDFIDEPITFFLSNRHVFYRIQNFKVFLCTLLLIVFFFF